MTNLDVHGPEVASSYLQQVAALTATTFCTPLPLQEYRCSNCGALLFRGHLKGHMVDSRLEIRCRRCSELAKFWF